MSTIADPDAAVRAYLVGQRGARCDNPGARQGLPGAGAGGEATVSASAMLPLRAAVRRAPCDRAVPSETSEHSEPSEPSEPRELSRTAGPRHTRRKVTLPTGIRPGLKLRERPAPRCVVRSMGRPSADAAGWNVPGPLGLPQPRRRQPA